jgi:hypothetical protein
MTRNRTIAAPVALLLVIGIPAFAKPVTPSIIDYAFEHSDDQAELVCGIVMTLADPPIPELVNFRLLAIKDKLADTVSLGFKLKVGSMLMRNGQPSGLSVTRLKKAELASVGFSSNRLIEETSEDGGIEMSTGVVADSQALYHMFVSESFILKFTPVAPIGMREYQINPSVPDAVQIAFQNCIDDF